VSLLKAAEHELMVSEKEAGGGHGDGRCLIDDGVDVDIVVDMRPLTRPGDTRWKSLSQSA
jgi:hypothetical protein